MAKFELSLAEDYVPDWTYIDAIRELFQNALDQQALNEKNKMFFNYSSDTKVLTIGSKSTVLPRETLLLGATTKNGNEDMIGNFGEGYKIATLVLTRENHPVTFQNYGAKEIWKPRFVNSTRYGAKVLTFFIDKVFTKNVQPPHRDLVMEIKNIEQEQYEKIVESNLHLQKDTGKYFETSRGRILMEERFKGKVFIGGLYVCDHRPYRYGYDFNPNELVLDRDRKLASDFELQWLASILWSEHTSEEMKMLSAKLIANDSADTAYMSNVQGVVSDGGYLDSSDLVYEGFKEKHGESAIPVSDQEELESVSKDFEPVLVSREHKVAIESSRNYKEPKMAYKPSPVELLKKWKDKYKDLLSEKIIDELESIIEHLD